jgi:hypothetical protein
LPAKAPARPAFRICEFVKLNVQLLEHQTFINSHGRAFSDASYINFFTALVACSEIRRAQAGYGLGIECCLLSPLKDKPMFAPASTSYFKLTLPSVRKVLAFDGTECTSTLHALSEYPDFKLKSLLRRQRLTEPNVSPEQRLDNLCAELQRQPLTEKEPFA